MSIYLAGPWRRREDVRAIRDQLVSAGFVVNASWLDVEPISSTAYGDATDDMLGLIGEAERDLADITLSDIMVVVNLEKSEGKAVEQGIALALGMPIIVIGSRTNVFQYLPSVTVVNTVEEAMEAMETIERRINAAA